MQVDTKAKEIKELQAKLEQTHVDLKYSYAEISNVSKRYKAYRLDLVKSILLESTP